MAIWSVKPIHKKSIIERQYWRNGGEILLWETGWRWGEFHVTTEDDNPPELQAGIDIYSCGYDAELVETSDGCWDEVDYLECSDETREKLEAFFEEGGSIFDLEEEGWYESDTEFIIDCDMEIEMIEPTGEKEESVDEEPKAKWPF